MMFLVIGIILATFELAHAQPFTCTELVGFSQTGSWSSTPAFTSQIPDGAWQTRIQSGGNIDVWKNRTEPGWFVAPGSPCTAFSTTPDRVVLTITRLVYDNSVASWVQGIRDTIATIRWRHPQVREIVLQPVVGGPNHAICPHPDDPFRGVRAAYNHPFIDLAIAEVVRLEPGVSAGPSPEVLACNRYRDRAGHLTPSGATEVGADIGAFYNGGGAGSTTTTVPGPTTTSTTVPCKLFGQNCAVIPCCAGQGTCQQKPWGWRCL
jgi:hypothetical protein